MRVVIARTSQRVWGPLEPRFEVSGMPAVCTAAIGVGPARPLRRLVVPETAAVPRAAHGLGLRPNRQLAANAVGVVGIAREGNDLGDALEGEKPSAAAATMGETDGITIGEGTDPHRDQRAIDPHALCACTKQRPAFDAAICRAPGDHGGGDRGELSVSDRVRCSALKLYEIHFEGMHGPFTVGLFGPEMAHG